ncbi:alpha/beta fold hydrolase [Candidatus Fermentibacteria bacterium]|nr:alpha/beta fold hydrolase [Candidatus Fermentibacteria bacterium]
MFDIDLGLLLTVNRGLGSSLLTVVMRFLTNVDNWIPFLSVLVVLLLLWGRAVPRLLPVNRRRAILMGTNSRVVLISLVLAVGASDLLANRIKYAVRRSRPCKDPRTSQLVEQRWHVHANKSFPSSHASNSAAMATVIALFYPSLGGAAYLLAFLVGLSRIYLGVHYPSDVMVGWFLGITIGGASWMGFKKFALPVELLSYTRKFRYRKASGKMLSPGRAWEPWEIRTLDGFDLTAWFRRCGDDLVVLVHGLNGKAESMSSPAELFNRRGFSTLIVPLRGHEGHPGRRTTGGPAEAYDLIAALEKARDKGFSPHKIVLYGSSMGAGVCLKAAGLLSMDRLQGIIAHGASVSFFGSVRRKLGKLKGLLLQALIPRSAREGLKHYRPEDYAGFLEPETALVLMHGSRDITTPPVYGEALMKKVEKSLLLVLGGAHHPSWLQRNVGGWQFEKALDEALRFVTEGTGRERIFIDEQGELRNLPASG